MTFGKDQGKSAIHSSSDISAVGQASTLYHLSHHNNNNNAQPPLKHARALWRWRLGARV